MKPGILQSGKLFQYERQQNYKYHKSKINQISRHRNKSEIFTPQSSVEHQFHQHQYDHQNQHAQSNGYKMSKNIRIQEENQRLLKKLEEISSRKKKEGPLQKEILSNAHSKFFTININSRNYQRQARDRSIQQENQKFVEKIMSQFKRNRNKSFSELDQPLEDALKRSRNKKKHKSHKSVNKFENDQIIHQKYEIGSSFLPSLMDMRHENNRLKAKTSSNKIQFINHSGLENSKEQYKITHKETDKFAQISEHQTRHRSLESYNEQHGSSKAYKGQTRVKQSKRQSGNVMNYSQNKKEVNKIAYNNGKAEEQNEQTNEMA